MPRPSSFDRLNRQEVLRLAAERTAGGKWKFSYLQIRRITKIDDKTIRGIVRQAAADHYRMTRKRRSEQ